MGATIIQDGELKVVRLTGKLRKSEMDAIQWGGVGKTPPDARVKVLLIAEAFEGWHRDDSWEDVSFVATYGNQIEKIALVADPKWEAQLLMFTGAGFRRTKIKFFPLDTLGEAHAWLAEPMPDAKRNKATTNSD